MEYNTDNLVQEVLNNIQREKKLSGEFIVVKSWEQGALKSQKCGVITLYYKINGHIINLHRVRICTVSDSKEQIEFEVFAEILSYITLNWEEVWNLINIRPQ